MKVRLTLEGGLGGLAHLDGWTQEASGDVLHGLERSKGRSLTAQFEVRGSLEGKNT
jgi:hypothetical protein